MYSNYCASSRRAARPPSCEHARLELALACELEFRLGLGVASREPTSASLTSPADHRNRSRARTLNAVDATLTRFLSNPSTQPENANRTQPRSNHSKRHQNATNITQPQLSLSTRTHPRTKSNVTLEATPSSTSSQNASRQEPAVSIHLQAKEAEIGAGNEPPTQVSHRTNRRPTSLEAASARQPRRPPFSAFSPVTTVL